MVYEKGSNFSAIISDPHFHNTDPNPAFYLNADPDLCFSMSTKVAFLQFCVVFLKYSPFQNTVK